MIMHLQSMCEPTLNRNSAVQHFERSDSVEIHDGIIYDFYTGLSHVHSFIYASVAAAADYTQNCVCVMCASLPAWKFIRAFMQLMRPDIS